MPALKWSTTGSGTTSASRNAAGSSPRTLGVISPAPRSPCRSEAVHGDRSAREERDGRVVMNDQPSARGGVMLPEAPQNPTHEYKANQQPARRGVLPLLAILVVGIAVGAGFAWAHFTGRLAPLYHTLGL